MHIYIIYAYILYTNYRVGFNLNIFCPMDQLEGLVNLRTPSHKMQTLIKMQ